jgi:hypothetical protein
MDRPRPESNVRGRGRVANIQQAPPRQAELPINVSNGTESFISDQVDFWSQLPPDKRQLMHSIFLQYRNQQIDYRQFLASSREVLGESLYGQLYQRLSTAHTSAPGTPPMGVVPNPQPPSMSMPSM